MNVICRGMYPEKHVLRFSPPVLVVKLLVGYNQYVETVRQRNKTHKKPSSNPRNHPVSRNCQIVSRKNPENAFCILNGLMV